MMKVVNLDSASKFGSDVRYDCEVVNSMIHFDLRTLVFSGTGLV